LIILKGRETMKKAEIKKILKIIEDKIIRKTSDGLTEAEMIVLADELYLLRKNI
jgi:hypothetical protein